MASVPMPRLSDSMTEGTIIRWVAVEGQAVTSGEEIVEIETDKATMVYEAEADGVIRQLAAEGETVPVGAPIALIDAQAQDAEADARRGPTAVHGGDGFGEVALSPAARLEFDHVSNAAGASDPAGVSDPAGSARPSTGTDGIRASESAPIVNPHDARAASGIAPVSDVVIASPVARRTALRLGVELSAVLGSGPRGRILKADVVRAARHEPSEAVLTPLAASPPRPEEFPRQLPVPATPIGGASAHPQGTYTTQAKGVTESVPLTRAQATVARRMAESKATLPDFQVDMSIDMTAAAALRGSRRESSGPTFTINDLVVRATALALRAHPHLNGTLRGDVFETYSRINVGIAVAGVGTLLVPTVFDADVKALSVIARETQELAQLARDGSLTPAQLSGGTFTVSNLGMLGVTRFAGIINPPQVAILCVGGIERRPIVGESGEICAASLLTATLVCDHRIIYGADAARFLVDLRDLLQDPLKAIL